MRAWLWGSLLLLLARPGLAATIVAVSEPELVARADTIVLGDVVRTETVVDKGGRIATRATVQVYRGLRGAAAGEVIVVEVPGGRLPSGLVAYSGGSPRLAPGDLVFGFLVTRGEVRRPLGLAYGLLRVRTAADGSLRVFRELDGLVPVSPGGAPIDPGAIRLDDEPLDALVLRVQKRLVELGVPAPAPAPAPGAGKVRP